MKGNRRHPGSRLLKGGTKIMQHHCRTKSSAKNFAEEKRERGFHATVYKKSKGYGVSVTKKK